MAGLSLAHYMFKKAVLININDEDYESDCINKDEG